MKIYLVRHGQSTHNADQDIPHDPDPPLTALGREQAQITARALREAEIGAGALYASPQRRALETGFALGRELGLAPHIVPDLCEAGGLREHAGLCRDAILAGWPSCTVDDRITSNGWWTGGLSEDVEAVYFDRAARAISLLRGRHDDPEEALIVVTHGRFGSALVSALLGLSPAGYSRFPFNNCGISRVDIDPFAKAAYEADAPRAAGDSADAIRLRFHNQMSHLPPSHRT
jgi:broad specificity phosphatase PhoE